MDTRKRKPASNFNPANILTIMRILLVPLYLWLFAQQKWYTAILAFAIFVIAAVTDLYDGRLARRRGEITMLGKFMDPLADKFLVIGALTQFCVMGLVNIWLVGIIILRDIWVTLMRVIAIAKNSELVTSGNAKLKTTIQLTVVITIIVFTGGRIVARFLGYNGLLVDISIYKILFNSLVSVAVAFTLYSWYAYLKKNHTLHPEKVCGDEKA